MKDLKVKIISGFRKDQEDTINADEAHKAYYLFLNPDARGIFSNGVAIIGSDIRRIEPDYNATMGWNPTYTPTGEDWDEISQYKVDRKLKHLLGEAQRIAKEYPERIGEPLSDLLGLPPKSTNDSDDEIKQLA